MNETIIPQPEALHENLNIKVNRTANGFDFKLGIYRVTLTNLKKSQYGDWTACFALQGAIGCIFWGRVRLTDARQREEIARAFRKRTRDKSYDLEIALDIAFQWAVAQLEAVDAKLEATDFNEPIDLATVEPEPMEWVVSRLIPARFTTNLYADSGAGKSYLALYLALCVIEGRPFVNLPVHTQGAVLYLDFELDKKMQGARWWAVARGAGYERPPSGLHYRRIAEPLSVPLQGRIREWVDRYRAALVIIDSIGKVLSDPLDPKLAIALYAYLDTLDVAVLAVDHIPKSAGIESEQHREYGTIWKRHYARSAVQMEKKGHDSDGVAFILRHQKSNFGALVPEIHGFMHLECDADSTPKACRFSFGVEAIAAHTEHFGTRGEILAHVQANPGCTVQEVADALGIDRTTVSRNLKPLESTGLVVTEKNGRTNRYRATTAEASICANVHTIYSVHSCTDRKLRPPVEPPLPAGDMEIDDDLLFDFVIECLRDPEIARQLRAKLSGASPLPDYLSPADRVYCGFAPKSAYTLLGFPTLGEWKRFVLRLGEQKTAALAHELEVMKSGVVL